MLFWFCMRAVIEIELQGVEVGGVQVGGVLMMMSYAKPVITSVSPIL